jgi:threonine/homoserine/homoserine lactone efflux protein
LAGGLPVESLLPLASFAFVASITPGPNNVMLAASGIAFGVRRTLPHMLGILVGFSILLWVCGLGVGALIVGLPGAALTLKVLGTAYLLYLTWALRRAFDTGAARRRARPLSFVEAFLFQFANPKAWLMGVTAASLFLPGQQTGWAALAAFWAVFLVVGIPCISAWATVGSALRRRVEQNAWRKGLGAALLVLMAYTVVAIWV